MKFVRLVPKEYRFEMVYRTYTHTHVYTHARRAHAHRQRTPRTPTECMDGTHRSALRESWVRGRRDPACLHV